MDLTRHSDAGVRLNRGEGRGMTGGSRRSVRGEGGTGLG